MALPFRYQLTIDNSSKHEGKEKVECKF